MMCSCCGLKITEKYHKIENGYICLRCWNDPNLFFPEKYKNSEIWREVESIYSPSIDSEEIISLPVIKLNQKGVTLYTGKLKAKQLLKLYGLFGFQEETLEGYQRDIYEDQVNDLFLYLTQCPVAIMPGLFISVREGVKFVPNYSTDNAVGTLDIPLKRGALWIIDGQHRIASFEKALASISKFDNDSADNSFLSLMDYEIPVTFIDSKETIKIANINGLQNISPSDIERMAFFIINKTQRKISPSLKDTLQYLISQSGMSGIPVIERNHWRTIATALAIDLNALETSPLYNKINISGRRGLNRPIQLNSFVSSLKPIFSNEEFKKLTLEEKRNFLLNYWSEIKKLYGDAFSDDHYKKYLILKSIGVYTMNLLINDYIKYHLNNGYDSMTSISIKEFLKNLNDFNWSKDSSPIANFGGMKGVKEARIELLTHMFGIETITLGDN